MYASHKKVLGAKAMRGFLLLLVFFLSGLKTACLPEQMLSLGKIPKPLASTVRNFFVKLLPALPPSRSTDRFLLLQSVRIQLSKSLTLYSCPPKTPPRTPAHYSLHPRLEIGVGGRGSQTLSNVAFSRT